jgi:arginyl-tRNA synthetase
MSSRLGGVPLALDVISTVEEEVHERAGEKIKDYSQKEKKQLTREIALSALRIAVLRSKPGININFDPEASLSFEGDSGPYLLYTHARCFSLLEKGGIKNPNFDQVIECAELEKILFHYNQILKESVEDIAPQKLVTYLFKVAQEFNSFYAHTVIVSSDKRKTEHNLAIVSWTKEVLRHGLYVLGITSPDRM